MVGCVLRAVAGTVGEGGLSAGLVPARSSGSKSCFGGVRSNGERMGEAIRTITIVLSLREIGPPSSEGLGAETETPPVEIPPLE